MILFRPCLTLLTALFLTAGCPAQEEEGMDVGFSAIQFPDAADYPDVGNLDGPAYPACTDKRFRLELLGYAMDGDSSPHIPHELLTEHPFGDPEQLYAFLLLVNDSPDYAEVNSEKMDKAYVFQDGEEDPRWSVPPATGFCACGKLIGDPQIPPHSKVIVPVAVDEVLDKARASIVILHAGKKTVLDSAVQEKAEMLDFPAGELVTRLQAEQMERPLEARVDSIFVNTRPVGKTLEADVEFRIPGARLRKLDEPWPEDGGLTVKDAAGHAIPCEFMYVMNGSGRFDSYFRVSFKLEGRESPYVDVEGTVKHGADIPVQARIPLTSALQMELAPDASAEFREPVLVSHRTTINEPEKTIKEYATYSIAFKNADTGFLSSQSSTKTEAHIYSSMNHYASPILSLNAETDRPMAGGAFRERHDLELETAKLGASVDIQLKADGASHELEVPPFSFHHTVKKQEGLYGERFCNFRYEGPAGDAGLMLYLDNGYTAIRQETKTGDGRSLRVGDGKAYANGAPAHLWLTPYSGLRTTTLPVIISGK